MKENLKMSTINNLHKTEALRFGFFISLLIVVFGCKKETKITAQHIVEKAVEHHGGLENWRNIKTLSFNKATTLFLEDGSIERQLNQRQTFHLSPELKGTIQDLNFQGTHAYEYDNGNFNRTANDSVWQIKDQKEIDALNYSFFAAHYVTCQPFELLSEKASLTLSGETEVNGKRCYVVDVTYEGDSENADKWTYIFDAETYELVANKVELTDHTSWIENLTFDTTTGLKFNAHRKSYRFNEAGEKTYLRAEYFYSNYQVDYK